MDLRSYHYHPKSSIKSSKFMQACRSVMNISNQCLLSHECLQLHIILYDYAPMSETVRLFMSMHARNWYLPDRACIHTNLHFIHASTTGQSNLHFDIMNMVTVNKGHSDSLAHYKQNLSLKLLFFFPFFCFCLLLLHFTSFYGQVESTLHNPILWRTFL
jgi:hypothetical protein